MLLWMSHIPMAAPWDAGEQRWGLDAAELLLWTPTMGLRT